jgi:hypothetical protein
MNPLDDFFLVFCPHCCTWQVKSPCNNWLHHMLMFGACMKFSFGWVNHGMIPFVFHPHCWAWKEKTPPNLQVLVFFLHMYVFFLDECTIELFPFFIHIVGLEIRKSSPQIDR